MPSVIIDHSPASAESYRTDWAIVVVDILRFTTTATTAVSLGRTVYPARTADDAFEIAERFANPLLVGELGGNVPYGFDLTNSPVQILALDVVPCGEFTSTDRPVILVSSSGAQLLMNSEGAPAVYLGCLRNISALGDHIAARHEKVAVLGAGTRGVFRREDQIGCARIAEQLKKRGFECADDETATLIEYWSGKSIDSIRDGKSAEYLTRTGQAHDLEFILYHQDDLPTVPMLSENLSLVDGALIESRN